MRTYPSRQEDTHEGSTITGHDRACEQLPWAHSPVERCWMYHHRGCTAMGWLPKGQTTKPPLTTKKNKIASSCFASPLLSSCFNKWGTYAEFRNLHKRATLPLPERERVREVAEEALFRHRRPSLLYTLGLQEMGDIVQPEDIAPRCRHFSNTINSRAETLLGRKNSVNRQISARYFQRQPIIFVVSTTEVLDNFENCSYPGAISPNFTEKNSISQHGNPDSGQKKTKNYLADQEKQKAKFPY